MIDLSNKHILITGGDISLLRGIITRLQESGATVTVSHHHLPILDMLSNDYEINKLPMNWHEIDDGIGKDLKRLEKIDGAIFCPLWQPVGRFIDTDDFDWDEALTLNYESTVFLSQAIVKKMIANKIAGSLVFLTSVATLMPFVDSSIVGTTLAMLRPLVKMIGVDCGRYGIRANMIAMGWIESESSQPHLDSHRDYIEQGIPSGKVGKPEQIGDVCAFLLSDLSQYMTGSVLTVDGGYTLTRSEGQSPYTPPIETSQQ